MGINSVILAVAKSSYSERDCTLDANALIIELTNLTHYNPEHWKGRALSKDVRDEFEGLYQSQIIRFINEMLNVLITPEILFFTLPNCSEEIVDFVRRHTVHDEANGSLIDYATFDFNRYGDPSVNRRKSDDDGKIANIRGTYQPPL